MPNYNPSDRKQFKIKRYCLNCKAHFYCDGSCEDENILDSIDFCYCPICWLKFFGKKLPLDDCRKHCQLLMDYLIKGSQVIAYEGWK